MWNPEGLGGMSDYIAEGACQRLRTCTDYPQDQLSQMGMPRQPSASVFAGMEFEGFEPVRSILQGVWSLKLPIRLLVVIFLLTPLMPLTVLKQAADFYLLTELCLLLSLYGLGLILDMKIYDHLSQMGLGSTFSLKGATEFQKPPSETGQGRI